MIRWAVLSAAIATAVFAQEIGSETPPPAETPPATAANKPPVSPPPSVAGASHGSAGAGSFGIRATFFGSPTANLPTAAVGVAWFLSDLLKITVDAGVAANFPQYPLNTAVGFSAAAGLDLMFRSPAASVRPFVTAQVGFGKVLSDKGDDFTLVTNLGAGAEYFFSQSFSINIRGLIALPLGLKSGTFGFLFFTPGIGATVYL